MLVPRSPPPRQVATASAGSGAIEAGSDHDRPRPDRIWPGERTPMEERGRTVEEGVRMPRRRDLIEEEP